MKTFSSDRYNYKFITQFSCDYNYSVWNANFNIEILTLKLISQTVILEFFTLKLDFPTLKLEIN